MTEFNFTKAYFTLCSNIKTRIKKSYRNKHVSVVVLSHQIGEEILAYLRDTPGVDRAPLKQLSEDLEDAFPYGQFYEERVLNDCIVLAAKYSAEDLKKNGFDQMTWDQI